MSVVTDVVLLTSVNEVKAITEINRYLKTNEEGQCLREISSHAGGCKAIQADIWAGAFNYMDTDGFIAFFKTVTTWEFPEDVKLLIQKENDNGFSEITKESNM